MRVNVENVGPLSREFILGFAYFEDLNGFKLFERSFVTTFWH